MSRIFPLLACVVLIWSSLARAEPAAPQPSARAQGGAGVEARGSAREQDEADVFLVQSRDGRQVYTNLPGMASHGQEARRVNLPPLSSVDFEHAPTAELRALDLRVSESFDALQTGELCEAIRKGSRIPAWSRLWADHSRKLVVAGALLVFAAILGLVGTGRQLGALFPVAPILGCMFLGYATYRDLNVRRDTLTAGLRACSEQLPQGDPEDKTAVQGRLSRALQVQSIVDGAFARQSAEIERAMREAR
jgi:hypothetical protein